MHLQPNMGIPGIPRSTTATFFGTIDAKRVLSSRYKRQRPGETRRFFFKFIYTRRGTESELRISKFDSPPFSRWKRNNPPRFSLSFLVSRPNPPPSFSSRREECVDEDDTSHTYRNPGETVYTPRDLLRNLE